MVNSVQDALCWHILNWTASRQVTRDPLRRQATKTVPGNFSIPHVPGSEGQTDPYIPLDIDTYPAHEPSDQQGRAHPPHTNRAPQTPSEGKPSTTSQALPGRCSHPLFANEQ